MYGGTTSELFYRLTISMTHSLTYQNDLSQNSDDIQRQLQMNNQKAIFIFTKDRPDTLHSGLESIREIHLRKFVLDDSVSFANQQAVAELVGMDSTCTYVGQSDYTCFIKKHHIAFPHFSFLLRQLGNPKWNLGYARNFALLFSKSLGLDKVLFMDDDIVVSDSRLVDELFDLVGGYAFVGAFIEGLVDDSILGYVATDLGIVSERILSGGFMLFSPQSINQFFLNIYNEDWVWLLLKMNGQHYLQTGSVLHTSTKPFAGYEDRLRFQEFGEIVIDGFLDLFNKNSYAALTSLLFWERMLLERGEYLDLLTTKAEKENKTQYKRMIEFLRSDPAAPYRAEVFQNLFQKHFEDQGSFFKLYNSL